MIGVLVLVGAALGVVGAMVHAHRVAQSAADLAALAGAAGAWPRRATRARRRPRSPRANGASLDSCAVDGFDVRLQVTVAGPHWLGQRHDLSAQARAGPG